MQCYKCKTTEDLSLKKMQRGIPTFICRPCRRAEQRARKARTLRKTYTNIDPVAWEAEAKASRLRIAARYANR